ncbi:MAG: undecaprenyl/decaprenyl-phosphate alpha-N-acetylglucosaminyl 1-phosphate transferase [Gammaproteobacteria bacterium]|nr:undecaprenyl/decaprenyl-phosphate alpha-N-acetylglucosaminyl 1-phosphate transferase [Gammaproteobacteria bacterium]
MDSSLLLEAYIGPVIALAVTSGLILWLTPVARAVGLVDVPSARKNHIGEVPLIGGLSIFAAVFAAMIVSDIFRPDDLVPENFGAFYLAGMILVIAGMVDDFMDLSPLKKLTFQTIATLIMIFGAHIVLRDLGMLGNNGELLALGFVAVPFTVFATIGVVNAVNMSDGLDGLAGTLSLVTLAGFFVATKMFGNGEDARHIAIIAAALFGFLLFNFRVPGRRSAVVFLGDSGSMFLGFALAWFAIKFSQGDSRIFSPSAALWFLIVPLFDAVAMTTRRILNRKPPFGADREHLHHIFLLAGFTVSETVLIMAGISVLGAGVGLAGTYYNVPEYILLSAFLVCGLLYLWMIMHSWSVMKFLRYSICRRNSVVDRRVTVDRRGHSNVVYLGPERRSGIDRRMDPRRSEDTERFAALKESDNQSIAS